MAKKTRIIVYLDPPEWEALKKAQERSGASISEIVRRCISSHLKKLTPVAFSSH